MPLVALIERPWELPTPSTHVLAAVTALGVLSTGIAFIMYFRILARNGATNISLVTFLVPVSAILLGALVLGEALEPREFAGFGLIALGLAAIDGRPARMLAGHGARQAGLRASSLKRWSLKRYPASGTIGSGAQQAGSLTCRP